MDIGAISTVVYFGLTATADGRIATSNADARVWRSGAVDELIARAHGAMSKVVFTLGRFSWTASETAASRTLLASSTSRAALARATADEVVRRGIDGVNVDFEPIPIGQAANFSDFVHRLRVELDAHRRGLQLTVDLVGHFDSYDVPGLVPSVDAIYLMGYHYAGWWSSVAMSTAPMGGPRYDVAETVAALRRWVPSAKLIVGFPYYGHLWPTKSGLVHARTTGRGSDLQQPQAAALAAAHGLRYDPVEQVAWSAWQTRDCAACPLHWVQVYYDDVQADTYKWAWIKAQGLLGTGIWTIGFEGAPGASAAALRAAFVAG
jgi:spore germination protein YaaH